MMALMGKLVILALVFEGFSVDSFALPYLWFALGLVTAQAGWKDLLLK
jgi:hypothetical protein